MSNEQLPWTLIAPSNPVTQDTVDPFTRKCTKLNDTLFRQVGDVGHFLQPWGEIESEDFHREIVIYVWGDE